MSGELLRSFTPDTLAYMGSVLPVISLVIIKLNSGKFKHFIERESGRGKKEAANYPVPSISPDGTILTVPTGAKAHVKLRGGSEIIVNDYRRTQEAEITVAGITTVLNEKDNLVSLSALEIDGTVTFTPY